MRGEGYKRFNACTVCLQKMAAKIGINKDDSFTVSVFNN